MEKDKENKMGRKNEKWGCTEKNSNGVSSRCLRREIDHELDPFS